MSSSIFFTFFSDELDPYDATIIVWMSLVSFMRTQYIWGNKLALWRREYSHSYHDTRRIDLHGDVLTVIWHLFRYPPVFFRLIFRSFYFIYFFIINRTIYFRRIEYFSPYNELYHNIVYHYAYNFFEFKFWLYYYSRVCVCYKFTRN